jgi:hypothetical protein
LCIRPELVARNDLDRGQHLAVAEPAIFVAGHQQVARLGEARVDLRHIAGNDHRIDVGPGDENAVDHIGRCEAQRDVAIGRQDDAARDELELGGDQAGNNSAIAVNSRAEVGFGELGRQVQCLGVRIFAVARRIDVHRQRREQDRAEDDRNDARNDPGPAQLGFEDGLFVDGHQPTVPRGRKMKK